MRLAIARMGVDPEPLGVGQGVASGDAEHLDVVITQPRTHEDMVAELAGEQVPRLAINNLRQLRPRHRSDAVVAAEIENGRQRQADLDVTGGVGARIGPEVGVELCPKGGHRPPSQVKGHALGLDDQRDSGPTRPEGPHDDVAAAAVGLDLLRVDRQARRPDAAGHTGGEQHPSNFRQVQERHRDLGMRGQDRGQPPGQSGLVPAESREHGL